MKSRKSIFRKTKDKPITYHEVDIDLIEDRPFNVIRTQSYTIFNLLPRTLLELLQFLPYSWFIFMLAVAFTGWVIPESFKVSLLTSLIFLVLARLARNAGLSWNQRKSDLKLNDSSVALFNGTDFTVLNSFDIREGDLILVKSGETAPADCLILAADSETNDFYVDMLKVDGSEDYLRKKAIKETQNFVVYDGMNIADLKKHLEFVKIVLPNSEFNSVEGKVKVKGSPRVLATGIEHFLMRGASVVDCGWVLGLVVYVSGQCKVWNGFKPKDPFSQSKLGGMTSTIMYGSFILLAVFVILTSFLGIFHNGLENSDSKIGLVFNSILLFGNLVPITLCLAVEIVSILKLFYINRSNHSFQLNHPKVLENLGKVEYIVSEKSGVLTSEKAVVQACLINENLYIDQNSEPSIPIGLRDSDVNDEISASNQSYSKSGYLTIDSLKNELECGQASKEKCLLAAALMICNNFMPGDSTECISSDEEALKGFSSRLGFKLIERSGQSFELENNSKRIPYSIISYADPGKPFIFKALIKENLTDEAILIQRGPLSVMNTYIQADEDAGYTEDYLNTQPFVSLKKVVFCYKTLSIEEVKLFMLDYKQVQSVTVNRKQRIIDMFENHTNDLKFLAMIGIDKEVPASHIHTAQVLQDAGVKLCLATREDEESAIATGFRLGLINDQLSVISLRNFSNPTEALHEVRIALKEEVLSYAERQDNTDGRNYDEDFSVLRTKRLTERRNMQKGLMRRRSSLHPMLLTLGYGVEKGKELFRLNSNFINFVVSIDGKTIDMAYKSHELLKNLVILLFSAKAIFAHGLCPEQKRKFVAILKENLDFKPSVLVIGKKFGNKKMINEATVGVVVKESFQKNRHEADIFVTSFEVLPKLLIETGTDYLYGFRTIAVLTLIKEMMTMTALFLFQSQCGFSSCFWIEADHLVVFDYGVSLFFIILIGLSSTQTNTFYDLRAYSSNFLYENHFVLRMLVSSSYSIFLGVLLYFFVLYGHGDVVKKTGMTEDFQTSGIILYILVNLVIFVNGFLISYEKIRAFLCVLLSLALLVIHLAVIINQDSGYLSTVSLTTRPSFWFLVCLFPLIGFICSFMTSSLFKSYYLKSGSRLSQYSFNIRKVFCDSSQLKFSKEGDDFELDSWTLTYKQYYRELIYRSKRFKTSLVYMRIFLVIVSVIAVISNVVVATGHEGFLNIKIYTVIVTVFQVCLSFSSFLIDSTKLVALNIISLVSFLVYCLVETFLNTFDSTSERYPVLLVVFSLLLYSTWKTTLLKSLMIFLLSVLVEIYETSLQSESDLAVQTTLWVILMFFVTLLTCIICYFQDRNRRNEYMFIQKVEIEVEKSANILSYLLPEFVRKRVKDGVRYIAEDKGTVSVIFCDICEFDKIVDLYSPQELTALIDDVFGRIDMICETLGITKIETVGKTYLACSGLKDSEIAIDQNILRISHARRAIEMGLEVLKDSQKTVLKDGSFITFKIGINSGPVTAGVVGFHKPQFSLVGDTVNTASRMASTLTEPNSIQISIATFEMLEDSRGLIFKDCTREVKGKGSMETKVVQPVVHNIEEIVTDELNLMFNRRRSSVLNMHSTPTFVMNSGRSSDMTGHNIQPRQGRSSLLLNLDIRTPSELMVKYRTRRLYKFFYYLLRETEEEKQFRKDHEKMITGIQKLGISCSGLCNCLLIIAESVFIAVDLKYCSFFRLLILIICEVCLVLSWKLMKTLKKVKFSYYLSSIFSVSFILLFIQTSLDSMSYLMIFIYFAYFYLLSNFFSGTFFKRNLIFNLPMIAMWLSVTFQHQLQLAHVTSILVYTLVIQVMVFANEKKLRVNAALKSAAEKELEKTQQLLTQMMPPHALSNLEEGKEVTDRLSKVTLLYADIVGFTSWSSIRTPREVVGMLSELFTRFDRMCVENNVYKVHTIGDCYVAMGYVNDKNRNPAKEAVNIIKFAETLISLIEETNEKCKIELGMRIGIHTGDIIAGITGTRIVRYDIYGADVLIANKMESNGEAGKIAVSESTKDIIESYIPGSFIFQEAKQVKISSLSKSIRMYFVTKVEKV